MLNHTVCQHFQKALFSPYKNVMFHIRPLWRVILKCFFGEGERAGLVLMKGHNKDRKKDGVLKIIRISVDMA